MQAVILAAGRGVRLRPLTLSVPKPLLKVGDMPIIAHTLNALPKECSEIIIVINYLGEQIKKYVGNSWRGCPVKYVQQKNLAGTGAALMSCEPYLKNDFIVLMGDDLYAARDIKK